MSILDTIQTFLSGIWFPSWDVYTDLALILKLLTATECVPYSFDSYVAKYPYYNNHERYNKQEQPSESKVLHYKISMHNRVTILTKKPINVFEFLKYIGSAAASLTSAFFRWQNILF